MKRALVWLCILSLLAAPLLSQAGGVEAPRIRSAEWLEYYQKSGTYLIRSQAQGLIDHHEELKGKHVLTTVAVRTVKKNRILSDVPDVKATTFSAIRLRFDDSQDVKQYDDRALLAVVGKVGSKDLVTKTINLTSCRVIATAEEAKALQTEINDMAGFLDFNSYLQAELKKMSDIEMASFIASCQELSYNDAMRRPKNHVGFPMRLSGRIVHVNDPLPGLSYVQIESNGHVWAFFHSTDEDDARLLEGDVVELYGRYIGLTPLLTSLFVKETLPFINVLYMKP